MKKQATEKDELWDVYTVDREKTGRTHRRGDKMPAGDYHMVVHVCIFNSKNELLLQQRQPFKEGWPNMWDLTVGGSALAGDTSRAAAERETLEEIGLKLDLSKERPYFTINFSDGFNDYYIIRKDIDISELKPQPEEVKQLCWFSREEVLAMQDEGTMIPYWFTDKLFDICESQLSRVCQDREIRVGYASMKNFNSWLSLIEIMKDYFPGLESEEKWEEYKKTVIKNIKRNSAVCALYGKMVVGILLFSPAQNMLSQLAVHPEFRKQGIASDMADIMLENLDRSRDIVVETYREEDKFGEAARAFYISRGFEPGELCSFEGALVQKFVLPAQNDGK